MKNLVTGLAFLACTASCSGRELPNDTGCVLKYSFNPRYNRLPGLDIGVKETVGNC